MKANLRATLAEVGAKMDPDRDLLFVILTSHGDQEGIGVATPEGRSFITPIELRTMLRESGARLSVVIVSSCYAGVFADALAAPDTLVITAADDDHASFGCRDGAKWTYFGEAFFSQALTKTRSLPTAFTLARQLIATREQAEGFDPSNPQMAGGERVLDLLGEPAGPALPRARSRARSDARAGHRRSGQIKNASAKIARNFSQASGNLC